MSLPRFRLLIGRQPDYLSKPATRRNREKPEGKIEKALDNPALFGLLKTLRLANLWRQLCLPNTKPVRYETRQVLWLIG
jgi:hypothetical protein